MRPERFVAGVVLLCTAVLSQGAIGAPACFPPLEVAHAKTVRVEKNGVIVLADGRAARLEDILLPAGPSDRAPQSLSERAISALSDITANRVVDLAAAPPKEDRYGRIRAQVVVHEKDGVNWVQKEMLRRGFARVAIAPDRDECAEELYAVEALARREKLGLWYYPAYAIRAPSQAENDVGTFQIVEGTINSVSNSGGRVFLDFAADEGTPFEATISADDMRRFREIGVDPYAYANERVRLRGWIERLRGAPEIALATPMQVEIVR